MSSVEAYLISSVMKNQDFTSAVGENITSEMFKAYPAEWEFLEKFYAQYKKTPSKKAFKQKFAKFMLKNVDDTKHFATEVKKAHALRLLKVMAVDIADFIAAGNVEDAVNYVVKSTISISATTGTSDDRDIIQHTDKALDEVKSRRDRVLKTGVSGIPTGFRKFDRITGGLQPGTLTIIGARLGEGKSLAMQRMCVEGLKRDFVSQFDALEQSAFEVTMRVHALLSADQRFSKETFDSNALMRGEGYSLDAYENFLRKVKKKIKGNLHVSDTSRGKVGLMTIASQIERNNPHVLYVDYLTLMAKKSSDWSDIGELSAGLKQLAQQYAIPIVAATQLNRSAGLGKDNAGAEAISGSDNIGQDADIIITMKRNSVHTTTMKCIKNRNGKDNFKWFTEVRPSEGIFREISYEKMRDIQDVDKDIDFDDEENEDDFDE